MKLGAIDFLTKPTTPDALRRVVAEVIDRHAARRRDEPARSNRPQARRSLAASWPSTWRAPSEPSIAASSARPKTCSAR